MDRAVSAGVRKGTAKFNQVVTIGSGGEIATVKVQGSFDGPRKIWQGTTTVREAGKPAEGSIVFIGTTNALYVTSPEWPSDIRGRWYRYTSEQLASATGVAAQIDTAQGLPVAAAALLEARAVAGTRSSTGTTVKALVPSQVAVGLAYLQSGLAKLKFDISSIKGDTEVTIGLDPQGQIRNLVLAPGALSSVSPQLPSSAASLGQQIGVVVTFDDIGQPVIVKVPKGKEIVPTSEMHN